MSNIAKISILEKDYIKYGKDLYELIEACADENDILDTITGSEYVTKTIQAIPAARAESMNLNIYGKCMQNYPPFIPTEVLGIDNSHINQFSDYVYNRLEKPTSNGIEDEDFKRVAGIFAQAISNLVYQVVLNVNVQYKKNPTQLYNLEIEGKTKKLEIIDVGKELMGRYLAKTSLILITGDDQHVNILRQLPNNATIISDDYATKDIDELSQAEILLLLKSYDSAQIVEKNSNMGKINEALSKEFSTFRTFLKDNTNWKDSNKDKADKTAVNRYEITCTKNLQTLVKKMFLNIGKNEDLATIQAINTEEKNFQVLLKNLDENLKRDKMSDFLPLFGLTKNFVRNYLSNAPSNKLNISQAENSKIVLDLEKYPDESMPIIKENGKIMAYSTSKWNQKQDELLKHIKTKLEPEARSQKIYSRHNFFKLIFTVFQNSAEKTRFVELFDTQLESNTQLSKETYNQLLKSVIIEFDPSRVKHVCDYKKLFYSDELNQNKDTENIKSYAKRVELLHQQAFPDNYMAEQEQRAVNTRFLEGLADQEIKKIIIEKFWEDYAENPNFQKLKENIVKEENKRKILNGQKEKLLNEINNVRRHNRIPSKTCNNQPKSCNNHYHNEPFKYRNDYYYRPECNQHYHYDCTENKNYNTAKLRNRLEIKCPTCNQEIKTRIDNSKNFKPQEEQVNQHWKSKFKQLTRGANLDHKTGTLKIPQHKMNPNFTGHPNDYIDDTEKLNELRDAAKNMVNWQEPIENQQNTHQVISRIKEDTESIATFDNDEGNVNSYESSLVGDPQFCSQPTIYDD